VHGSAPLPHTPDILPLCSTPHRALLTLPAAIPVTRNPRKGRASAVAAGAELAAIFRVMADLLGDPAWPQLHPWPYTDMSWPGIQCELAPDETAPPASTWAPTSPPRPVGPGLGSTPPRCAACRTSRRSPSSAASAPPTLFMSSSSLEQIVLKSNLGLTGPYRRHWFLFW
jgi:hypothetical protein